MVRTPKGIWRRFKRWYQTTYWLTARKIAIVLAGLLVIVTVFGSIAEYGFFNLQRLFLDMWGNLSAELAGIVITVWVIDSLNRRRAIAEEKEDLILQMGSPDNAFALEAVRKLRARGWLTDGSVRKAYLFGANLKATTLEGADLQWAHMGSANLHTANLSQGNLYQSILNEANLENARLEATNLQRAQMARVRLLRANLHHADLKNANLQDADLRETNLKKANLQGADLTHANLLRAVLDDAAFDERTVLPDGSRWRPESDILRFTSAPFDDYERSPA